MINNPHQIPVLLSFVLSTSITSIKQRIKIPTNIFTAYKAKLEISIPPVKKTKMKNKRVTICIILAFGLFFFNNEYVIKKRIIVITQVVICKCVVVIGII